MPRRRPLDPQLLQEVPVQNLTKHPKDWGRFILPAFTSPNKGWGVLPYETAKSLKESRNPDYNVPDLPVLETKVPAADAPGESKADFPVPIIESKVLFKPEQKSDGPMPVLMMTPAIPGGSFSGQTPLEVSKQLGKTGHKVLYSHLPPPRGMRHPEYTAPQGVRGTMPKLEANFHSGKVQDVALEEVTRLVTEASVLGPGGMTIATAPLPAYGLVAKEARKRLGWTSVYYVVDDWVEFDDVALPRGVEVVKQGRYNFLDSELIILEHSDVVVVTSKRLKKKFDSVLPANKKAKLIPNAFDPVLFPIGKTTDAPADMQIGNPTVVMWGSLFGSWIDWPLLREVADGIPSATFNIIGAKPQIPSVVSNAPNIHWLGWIDTDQLWRYGVNADVGIIPFAQTKLVEGVNPIKMYEYLACGLNVVASGCEDIKGFTPAVVVPATANGFISAVVQGAEKTAELRASAIETKNRRKMLLGNTWGTRTNALLAAVSG